MAVLGGVSTLLWKNGNALNATAIALSLVFGGALGNLWDRVASGRVIDFLDFYMGSHHWPAFNIADSAIVEIEKDRKSTRLNSSHQIISYAVFCLKKKKKEHNKDKQLL